MIIGHERKVDKMTLFDLIDKYPSGSGFLIFIAIAGIVRMFSDLCDAIGRRK